MSDKKLKELVALMAVLRSKKGCPWDRAQTFSSMKKHIIEEAYEVCDAIDSKNTKKIKDELGDLLFQVIFCSQIAREADKFNISDVLDDCYKKMIRRHPHVFGKYKAKDPDEAYKHWQKKKEEENRNKGEKRLLIGVPRALPALLKAQKVSKRASWLGFDWPDAKNAFKKIGKELTGAKKAIRSKNKPAFSREIGKLLFAIVNLAHLEGIEAEEALHSATEKFARQFRI